MYPKVNQNIIIEMKEHDKISRSIVAEVGTKEILLSLPMDGNIVGMLTVGTLLDVSFISGENKYLFQTEIIGRTEDKIPLIRVAKPQTNEIKRIQLRNNFRVNANLRLVINDFETNTLNISAGGILFSSKIDCQLKEGEKVSGTLYIPNMLKKTTEMITFLGLINRIDIINAERKNVALEFNQIDERNQNKIIQFSFEKQRQNRLKER
ncbi:flagellar brake protein [Neobacillus ginsengisoli]|uniref:C-di-GMP-binding flagellar brake protein YcgR n=1 Tax=Neobacillus ginsengisoli TaxID=904295 RepID=A0ABT9XVG1_9BACI|nr:flagellar brake protein [Neobacillus ginsengisoli]MDQ0199564.1 c-di-GMP-binding flagellar brake protein YcgR [Neobacillus ginsengisoli]